MTRSETLRVEGAVNDRLDMIGHRGCNRVEWEEVNVVDIAGAKDSSISDEWTIGLRKVW
jgi:hypothetical protein